MEAPLTDRFGRSHTYLRVSITERCNLRCAYCMPPEGIPLSPKESILQFEEIVRLVGVFAGLGVDKVRITGGEPLVRRDVQDLVAALAEIPGILTVAMTTNGVLLQEKVQALRSAGLSSLNVSLDTLKPGRFDAITQRSQHQKVLDGIEAAIQAGYRPLKLNVVVMGGVNDDEILNFIAFADSRPVDVRFIEYMPFDGNDWSAAEFVPYKEMLDTIQTRYTLQKIPGKPNDVAKDFRIAGSERRVSFITSMSDSFCGTCNRLRLTADGSLKTCLHHPAEVSLRDLMRLGASDAVLKQTIRDAVMHKEEGHAPAEELVRQPNRSMVAIGG